MGEYRGSGGEARSRVVLIGPGRLGLGLLAGCVDRLHLDLVLCGRSTNAAMRAIRAHGQYVAIGGTDPYQVAVHELVETDTSDGEARLRVLLRDSSTLVVLVAVKDGQCPVADLITRALTGGSRQDQDHLLIIPCENRAQPCLTNLQHKRLVRPIAIGRAMVDRVCLSPEIDASGALTARAEAFYEWCIELPKDVSGSPWYSLEGQMLTRQLGAKLVPDIEPIHYRKLMMLNGLHASIAAVAMDACTNAMGEQFADPTISDFLSALWGGQNLLLGLQLEYAAVVADAHPATREEIDEWTDIYEARILGSPQPISEILRRYAEGDMADLLVDFEAKVARPLEVFERYGSRSVFIAKSMQAFGRLIQKRYSPPQA